MWGAHTEGRARIYAPPHMGGVSVWGAPHMGAPSYEGAPIPITAYLAVGSKAAAIALILRLFTDRSKNIGGILNRFRELSRNILGFHERS